MALALYRLIAFVALTAVHALALAARTGGRVDVEAGQEQAQKWARDVLAALGVRLDTAPALRPVGALYVANHRSYIDIPVLLACAPVTYLAKAEVARWPLLGWAARCAGTLFVQREARSSRAQARLAIGEQLSLGRSVAVFPEGTTTAGPGLLPMKPGCFELAAARVPVVPVAVHYDLREDAWTGDDGFLGHFLRRFAIRERRVTVRFGPPLFDADPVRLRARASAWLHDELAAIERRHPSFDTEENGHEEAIQHPRAA